VGRHKLFDLSLFAQREKGKSEAKPNFLSLSNLSPEEVKVKRRTD